MANGYQRLPTCVVPITIMPNLLLALLLAYHFVVAVDGGAAGEVAGGAGREAADHSDGVLAARQTASNAHTHTCQSITPPPTPPNPQPPPPTTTMAESAHMKSPVLERLEAAKAAREARTADGMKAELDAKMAAATAAHEASLDAVKTAAGEEVAKAKRVAAAHPHEHAAAAGEAAGEGAAAAPAPAAAEGKAAE